MPWVRPTSEDPKPSLLLASALLIVALSDLADPAPAARLVLLLPAVAVFGLWARFRQIPPEVFAALVIAPVALVVLHDGELEGTFFLVNVMVLVVAWTTPSLPRVVAIAAVAVVVPWLVNQRLVAPDDIGWEAWAIASLFTASMGRLVRGQGKLIEELEQARTTLAEQAVAEERRRIATELHDLAGHTLAAVMLHVTGARHVLRRDLDDAEEALLEAERLGRASLDQIRAAVRAMRTDELGTEPPLATADDVPTVVEEYRRAGLDVDANFEGLDRLQGPVAVAAHRIIRESLANVARHAPTNAVTVECVVDGGGAHVTVTDHGRRPAPMAAGGFGVVGMTERARALGGELRAAPTDDGWRVTADLPVALAAEPR